MAKKFHCRFWLIGMLWLAGCGSISGSIESLVSEVPLSTWKTKVTLPMAEVNIMEGAALTVLAALAEDAETDTTYRWSIAPQDGRFLAFSGSGSVLAGQRGFAVSLQTINDLLSQGNSSYVLTIQGANFENEAQLTINVIDDETFVGLSLAAANVNENAGVLALTFSLTQAVNEAVTFNYATANGTATAGADYSALSGSATIPAGQTQVSVNLTVLDDAIDEIDETLSVSIANASSAVSVLVPSTTITILDDDAPPALAINDVSIGENVGPAIFTVSLSQVSGKDVTVNYLASGVTAIIGVDFSVTLGTLTIPAGQVSGTISVPITDDLVYEGNETFAVDLSAPSNATLSDSQGIGAILDDDGLPSLAIANSSALEDSGNLVFTVTKTGSTVFPVSVDYLTSDGTAVAGSDYNLTAATLSIPAGSSTGTIAVPMISDNIYESDETFTITLSNPVGASIATATATGTIVNDEAVPAMSIADAPDVTEGGTSAFTVSINRASSSNITFNWVVNDGTAVDTQDYTDASGMGTILAGSTSTTVSVVTLDDAQDEPTENFSVVISGYSTIADSAGVGQILDNDAPPSVAWTKSHNASFEDTQNVSVVASLSASSGYTVTVDYTISGSATGGGVDYTLANGTLSFAPGVTTASATLAIVEDNLVEADETVELTLTNPSNVTLGTQVHYIETIRNDDGGTVIGWGDNSSGQIGNGYGAVQTPAKVLGNRTWSVVSPAFNDGYTGHTCGITTSGEAYCWGENNNGQLGNGTLVSSYSPVKVSGGLSFSAISTAYKYTCGITTTGVGYCWGANSNAQLGVAASSDKLTPNPIAGGLTFAQISTGSSFACGVTTTNVGYCWGTNTLGRLGDGTTNNSVGPVAVSGSILFSQISAGRTSACGRATNGNAYCWGDNTYGKLGDGSTTPSYVPVLVSGGLTFSKVAVHTEKACGLTATGAAYCWGRNLYGALGNGNWNNSSVPSAVVGGHTFTDLSGTCGTKADGSTYCWGTNDNSTLGTGVAGDFNTPQLVAGGFSFSSVSGRANTQCAITSLGVVYCWGQNGGGNAGVGTTSNRVFPTLQAAQLSQFVQVSAARYHSCGLTPAGAAYCWGRGNSDELGLGTGASSYLPVAVSGGHQFVQVAAGGDSYSCGLKATGQIYCWGAGLSGAGTTPQLIPGGNNFVSLEVGSYRYACGIEASGAAYCWGEDTNGTLGNGAISGTQATPTLVDGNLKFRQISAGSGTACGVTMNGDAYCWGAYSNGFLGNASASTDAQSPLLVDGGHKYKSVALGRLSACGLRMDDTVVCWGSGYGAPPVALSGVDQFQSITVGNQVMCGALKSTGLVKCWGSGNFFYEAGTSGSITSTTPSAANSSIAVSSLSFGELYGYSALAVATQDLSTLSNIQLSSGGQSVSESAGTVTLSFSLNQAFALPVIAVWEVTGGTATHSGADHDAIGGEVLIPAGATSATASFNIVNDGIAEADETIVVTLHSPLNGNLGAQTTHTITITNDDAPTFANVNPTPAQEGATITITGTGFLPGMTATIGGVACLSPTVVNSTTFTCVVPSGVTAGAVDIVLTNTAGAQPSGTRTVTVSNGITVQPNSWNFGTVGHFTYDATLFATSQALNKATLTPLDLTHNTQGEFDAGTHMGTVWSGSLNAFTVSSSTNNRMNLPNLSSTSDWFNMSGNQILFHFDETSVIEGAGVLSEASGNSFAGTLSTGEGGGGIKSVTGKLGNGLAFDEINDILSYPTGAPTTSNLSLALWYKNASLTGSAYQYLVSIGSWDTMPSINVNLGELSGAGLGFNISCVDDANNHATFGFETLASVNDRNWHQVVVVKSASGVFLYKDGAFIGSNAGCTGSITLPATGYLGGRGDLDPNRFFNGTIDEYSLWTRALSPAEISALYKQQSPKYAGVYYPPVSMLPSLNNWGSHKWRSSLPFYKELPGDTDANGSPNSESSVDYSAIFGGGASLASGLVGLWRFEEAALDTLPGSKDFRDESGSGNHAFYNASTQITLAQSGKFNKSLQTNHVCSEIYASDSSSLNSAYVSVSAWIKPQKFDSTWRWNNIVGKTHATCSTNASYILRY